MSIAVELATPAKPLSRVIPRAVVLLIIHLLVLAVAVGWVNYFVDSAGSFRLGYAHRKRLEFDNFLAANLKEPGATCEVRAHHNRIELLVAWLKQVGPARIEVVQLGSSLQAVTGREVIEDDEHFLNAWFSCARVPQLVAMYELLRQHGVRPKKVVIGVDSWSFGQSAGDIAEFETENAGGVPTYELSKLFDPEYARINFRFWLNDQFAEVDKTAYGMVYDSDLSVLQWPQQLPHVNLKHAVFRPTPLQTRFDELTALLDQIARDGAACELLLSPINLDFADDDLRQLRRRIEVRLRALAAERGLLVRGSYDPEILGLTPLDFADFGHPRRQSFPRIFNYVAPVAGPSRAE
jgi:hypothetical protein